MKSQIDEYFAKVLSDWMDVSRRNSGAVIAACLGVTVIAGAFAVMHLGINSDNVRLISEDLPSRRNHEAFAKLFPNLENALLVVIDAETPELARHAEDRLVARLDAESGRFADAYPAAGGEFFETHGLLYRSLDDLDVFAAQLARLQPIIAALEQDASVANLSDLVAGGLEQSAGAEGDGIAPEEWAFILDSVGDATVEVYTEFPLALSWEKLLLQGSAIDVSTRRVVVVHPELDFGSFLAAGRAMDRIREIASEEGLSPERGVGIRITGNPGLNFEEMIGLAWDLGGGGVICFFFVIAVLTRALRSLRLVMAAVITLLVGLIWTAGFAAAVIGHLSLVSASFAVLFIGLGVDFAIHLGMAYAARIRLGATHETALRDAAATVGSSLVICTVTTSIGFFVFVPTDYLGVAELGLIAGSGMFIILFLTLTLLPALLSGWFIVDASQIRSELHLRSTWWRVFETHPGTVVLIAALLLAGGLALIPQARFDVNVVQMRDPTTESVQAFNDLLAQSGAMSPWYINSMVDDLEAVPARVDQLRALESVSHTVALTDYVPADQEEKLELLSDLGYLLDVPPVADAAQAEDAPPVDANPSATQGEVPSGGGERTRDGESDETFEEQIEALRALHDLLGEPWLRESRSEMRESIALLHDKLGDFLRRVDEDGDPAAAVAKLDELLLAGFPAQIERLKRSIDTDAIERADLPPELIDRMVTPDGRARIQVFPKYDLSDEVAFSRFTDEVLRVDPAAAGVAVNLVGFGRATRSSFRQALISAVVLISVLLLVLWRSFRPVGLVLAPLLLSSVLTVAGMAVLDIPFNFANVVVVPLMLGIGVDSGIHLVHRAELMAGTNADLMDSTTARAVFYSAITTLISFGTLAFSSHRGVASLGVVLSIGMVCTVFCNLIVLPALIRVAGMQGDGGAQNGDARSGGAGTTR